MGLPQYIAGWFISWNIPNLKWMRTGGDNYGTKSPDGECFSHVKAMATPSVHWAQHDISAPRWMISPIPSGRNSSASPAPKFTWDHADLEFTRNRNFAYPKMVGPAVGIPEIGRILGVPILKSTSLQKLEVSMTQPIDCG